MKTIWKFPFEVKDILSISMPEGAQILHVGVQAGPCIWALVDTDAPKVCRGFRVFGTGHEIPDHGLVPMAHVATFQMGPFVWHLFDGG